MTGTPDPSRDPAGTSEHGFTVGERAEVISINHEGYFGTVIKFAGQMIAIDLNEPPVGSPPEGVWWICYRSLRHAPKK